MNKKLKFSWGHIFAFFALIAISYLTFMGTTYYTDGDFTTAIITMGVVDFVFFIFFIGAQQLKGTGILRGKTEIRIERILIFGSPIVFIAGMLIICHFWTVYSQNDELVETFTSSIDNSKKMFDDYEAYAEKRIGDYGLTIDEIIANRETNPEAYKKAGLTPEIEEAQKANMLEVLRLQLLSSNYDKLRSEATAWIDNANKGASTWNVFLLGNLDQIKSSINSWQSQLASMADKRMSIEDLNTPVPDFESIGASEAIAGIDGMTTVYTTAKSPTVLAIGCAVLLYLMLIFPYVIQQRYSRNIYTLFGKRKINLEDDDSLNFYI